MNVSGKRVSMKSKQELFLDALKHDPTFSASMTAKNGLRESSMYKSNDELTAYADAYEKQHKPNSMNTLKAAAALHSNKDTLGNEKIEIDLAKYQQRYDQEQQKQSSSVNNRYYFSGTLATTSNGSTPRSARGTYITEPDLADFQAAAQEPPDPRLLPTNKPSVFASLSDEIPWYLRDYHYLKDFSPEELYNEVKDHIAKQRGGQQISKQEFYAELLEFMRGKPHLSMQGSLNARESLNNAGLAASLETPPHSVSLSSKEAKSYSQVLQALRFEEEQILKKILKSKRSEIAASMISQNNALARSRMEDNWYELRDERFTVEIERYNRDIGVVSPNKQKKKQSIRYSYPYS